MLVVAILVGGSRKGDLQSRQRRGKFGSIQRSGTKDSLNMLGLMLQNPLIQAPGEYYYLNMVRTSDLAWFSPKTCRNMQLRKLGRQPGIGQTSRSKGSRTEFSV